MGTVAESGTRHIVHPLLSSEFEKSKRCVTEFHLTGFSRFHNVPVNPTELVVTALPKYLEEAPLKNRALLASARVLKVAAKSTREELQAMYKGLDVPSHPFIVGKSRAERRIVFVHLGVNVCVNHFQLEIQGRNEATFTCPDELGWTPMKRPIDPDNCDLYSVCRTTLKLDPLISDLRRKGFKVDMSSDAGRFVCNWVYYNSLQLAEANGATALFVHVPPASVVPVGRQTQFIAALMNSIAKMS